MTTETTARTITVEKVGRRHYIRNTPFAMKGRLKSAGCKWDPEQRAWWTGKAEVAERFAGQEVSVTSSGDRNEGDGDRQTVAGRAKYKGRTYYLVGRDTTQRRYEESVETVTTRDGSKVLLCFRDGSRKFWAVRTAVDFLKTYDTPKTIGALRRYAEQRKAEQRDGQPRTRSALYEHLDMLDQMDCFQEAERFAAEHGLRY